MKRDVYARVVSAMAEREEPDPFFRLAFSQTLRATEANREMVDARSATQRPPLDPSQPYVLDVGSSKWKKYVPEIQTRSFASVINSCQ
jgi:hypothetical protein